MANTARDLIKCRISNAPGTTGSFILSTAFTNSLLPASGDNGLQFKLNITENGVGTEIRRNCTYTHSTTTFGRGTMVRSTAAADAALNFTAAAIVSVVPSAEDYLTTEQAAAVRGAQFADLSTTSTLAAATANRVALQARLDTGGLIVVSTPGTYLFDLPLAIGSNTRLILGDGVTFKQKAEVGSAANQMLVSKQYQRMQAGGASVTFTWSAGDLLATINWTSHGLVKGDYVLTQGASPSAFNVMSPVVSVTSANAFVVALKRVPTASPTGTITAIKADQNVFISGGTWDYDYATNTGSATGNQGYTMILCGNNVHLSDTNFLNGLVQNVQFAACSGYSARRINVPSTASGVFVVGGCAFNGVIQDIEHGSAPEDGISVQPRVTDAFSTYRVAVGDVIGLVIENWRGYHTATGTGLVVLYPTQNQVMDQVYIRNITGEAVNAAGVMIYNVDPGLPATMQSVEIDGVNVNCRNSIRLRNIGTTLTIDKLTIRNVVFNPDNIASHAFYSEAAATVNNLEAQFIMNVPGWPSSGNGYLAVCEGPVLKGTWEFNIIAGTINATVPLTFSSGAANAYAINTVKNSFFSSGGGALSVFSIAGTATNHGTLVLENSKIECDYCLNTGDACIAKVVFVGGNRLVNVANGLVRGPTGADFSIHSDGTNVIVGTTVWAGSTATFKAYGWDIAVDPIALPLAAVAGQFFTSTRTGATNQGPARSNAANFVALGTGAAGVNTVIS